MNSYKIKPSIPGRLCLLAGAVSLWFGIQLCGFAQGTVRITFDGPPEQAPGTQYGVADYSEAGVLFVPVDGPYEPGHQLTRNGGGFEGYPENGSAYIQCDPAGLQFSFVNGALFGLRAVDLAGYSTVVPEINLRVLGYRLDGTILSTSFSGSGIDWHTVYFDNEWASGLTRVEFPKADFTYIGLWSMDNLILAVPEPGSCTLIIFGLLAITLRRLTGKS